MAYTYRIVNVFAEAPLAGNPLCVFEDARGLDDATMQALALQFNLSETTFILPSAVASARVRIFTPTFEMPFAGHPTLGTAHVARALGLGGDALTLEMKAGIIPVRADGDRWTLTAAAPKAHAPSATRAALASALGLDEADVGASPLWVDTGSQQLIVPLTSFAAVRRCSPKSERLASVTGDGPRVLAYVFAREGDHVLARFFFDKHGAIIEDPGTGSACANLGGWLVATGAPRPQRIVVDQGAAVGRPCRLTLTVDADGAIGVGGRVIELGRGTLALDAPA
ncbi:MAG: PhzF family phenazine biosynthesis protein [Proteobacteria bacterium]|nr:PhzF family phenazine biosynthesis protein [Pseudomonadota bacterium]